MDRKTADLSCPKCGNDSFQEVGRLQATTPVRVHKDGGRVVYVRDEEIEADAIWETYETGWIECSSCLERIEAADAGAAA